MSDEIRLILARCTGFEWDKGNAPKVAERHGVQPAECEEVFFQEPMLVSFDATHSSEERRWQALGKTSADRTIFLVFTVRETLIRVIAARDMHRKERKLYAEAQAGAQGNPNV